MSKIKMEGVREHSEGMDVELTITDGKFDVDKPENNWLGKGRIVIKAFNESGYNSVQIDLEDLMDWINKNKSKIEQLKND